MYITLPVRVMQYFLQFQDRNYLHIHSNSSPYIISLSCSFAEYLWSIDALHSQHYTNIDKLFRNPQNEFTCCGLRNQILAAAISKPPEL